MSVTTTELIELLKSVEFGASGRPRAIDLILNEEFINVHSISVNSTGDGIAGAELCLEVEGKHFKDN